MGVIDVSESYFIGHNVVSDSGNKIMDIPICPCRMSSFFHALLGDVMWSEQ